MGIVPQNGVTLDGRATLALETKPSSLLSLAEITAMQRRRYQKPKPEKHGQYWTIRYWKDFFEDGRPARKQVRERLGEVAKMTVRQAQRAADEKLAPINQGKQTVNGSITFKDYVTSTYKPCQLPLLRKSSQSRYRGILDSRLIPAFGDYTLSEITVQRVQLYFNSFADSTLRQETREKIWTVLSAVMRSAIPECISVNPCLGVKLPAPNHGQTEKPFLTADQFRKLVSLIAEPYSTMVYVSALTGLRISELAALRWKDVSLDSLTVDEGYCRGAWAPPKSKASIRVVPLPAGVFERIESLKTMTVEVGGGRAGYQTFKVVKSTAPDALVFQSVRSGKPLRDNNVLSRHIKPAARALGIPWVNWRCLRRSYATWCKETNVQPRDAQKLLGHSRVTTTLEIYQQTVDAHLKKAVAGLEGISKFVQ
jgi:integrase